MAAQKSGIEWTDATWNPITGCSKVSPGCANCYAEGVADRFWAKQYRPIIVSSGKTLDTISTSHHEDYLANGFARPRRFTDVMCHEDRLDQPLRWKKPRRIFVNSMSDLFHDDVPDEFIDKVFAVMALAPQHTFQVLTKRAERMRAYMDLFTLVDDRVEQAADWIREQVGVSAPKGYELSATFRRAADALAQFRWPLPNVWLGVSVENQRFADERIPLLLQTPAAVRFISAEPLLGPVDLSELPSRYDGENRPLLRLDALRGGHRCDPGNFRDTPHLDWVIVGGESGRGARPFDAAWADSIIQQCKSAGVPVFVKQMGGYVIDRNDRLGTDRPPEDPRDWPEPECGWDDGYRGNLVRDLTGFRDGYQGAPVRIVLENKKGGDPAEWPEDLRVREFPEVSAVTMRDSA